MPVQFPIIAYALLQEQSSQDGSSLNDISTEDGQLLLKSIKKGVCVWKELNGTATAYWVEKDTTRSSVFQIAEMLGRGFALSQKALQAPSY